MELKELQRKIKEQFPSFSVRKLFLIPETCQEFIIPIEYKEKTLLIKVIPLEDKIAVVD